MRSPKPKNRSVERWRGRLGDGIAEYPGFPFVAESRIPNKGSLYDGPLVKFGQSFFGLFLGTYHPRPPDIGVLCPTFT